MIGGLAFQVASLFLFAVLVADFAFSVWRSTEPKEPHFAALRASLRFRLFLAALVFAWTTIFVRCCYRVAELQAGFGGALANNEGVFMGLEGPMIFVAVGVLTVWHPGYVYGSLWTAADFSFRRTKTMQGEGRAMVGGEEMADAKVGEAV